MCSYAANGDQAAIQTVLRRLMNIMSDRMYFSDTKEHKPLIVFLDGIDRVRDINSIIHSEELRRLITKGYKVEMYFVLSIEPSVRTISTFARYMTRRVCTRVNSEEASIAVLGNDMTYYNMTKFSKVCVASRFGPTCRLNIPFYSADKKREIV